MTRARRLATPLLLLLVGAGLLAALLAMQARGYGSASNLDLWGRTLLANQGLIALDDLVTAFPPLPYLGTIALAWLFPGLGAGAPQLLAVLLAAGLAAAWFSALRRTGFRTPAALAATLLLVANPLFIRAVAEGAGFVLLHWGVWLLALGMFQLRRAHRVNDIILVSTALGLIVLAHPFGLVLAFACLPFVALVVPPDRLRAAPASVFLVLLFPLLFTLAAFAYVNWVFAGAPFHFLSTLSRETAGLGAGAASDPAGSVRLGVLAAIGLFAACPIGVSMFVRTAGMPPLRLAIGALLGLLIAATMLAALAGVLPALALVVSLGVPLAAACAVRWPHERPGRPAIVLMLTAGFAGALVVTFADRSPETERWRAALAGAAVAPPDAELAALGAVLAERQGVLFDAEAAPMVIAARGGARGIWSADTPEFRSAGMRGRTDAEVLVVRNRAAGLGADRVGRMFPDLYDKGRRGYARVFDSQRWRAYARSGETP